MSTKNDFLNTLKGEYELLGVLGDNYDHKGRSEKLKLLRLEEVRDLLRDLMVVYKKNVIKEDYEKGLKKEYKDDNTNWDLMNEVGNTGWTQDQ